MFAVTLTCEADGNWDKDLPECKGKFSEYICADTGHTVMYKGFEFQVCINYKPLFVSQWYDKHAPEVSCTFIKGPAEWLSDSFLLAKAIRHQFQHIWCKDKSPQN